MPEKECMLGGRARTSSQRRNAAPRARISAWHSRVSGVHRLSSSDLICALHNFTCFARLWLMPYAARTRSCITELMWHAAFGAPGAATMLHPAVPLCKMRAGTECALRQGFSLAFAAAPRPRTRSNLPYRHGSETPCSHAKKVEEHHWPLRQQGLTREKSTAGKAAL